MIITRTVLSLAVVLVAYSARGAEPAAEPTKEPPAEEGRHYDRVTGFSIKFPKDWE